MFAKAVVGFIGLGSQGGPMVKRMLAAGFPLYVWARRPEAVQPFIDAGAHYSDLEALGHACDHVGICVLDDAGVSEICGRLIPVMRSGSLLAVHSTVLPDTCEALARRAAASRIQFLDAPVSGGGPAAAVGQLTVICGADPAALVQARPVLESFAGKIFHVGPPGAAQRVKILNNALMAANMGLVHQVLAVAERLGVDRTTLVDVILHGSGRSFGGEVYARLPSLAAFAHGAALLDKDVKLLSVVLRDADASIAIRRVASGFLDAALQATPRAAP